MARSSIVAALIVHGCAQPTTAVDHEQEICRGVGVTERDMPFWAGGVEAVREIRERDPRNLGSMLRGAEISVVAAPGLTRAWLERRARCHAVRHRNAVLPDTSIDPLAVDAAEITVRETGPVSGHLRSGCIHRRQPGNSSPCAGVTSRAVSNLMRS